METVPDDPNSCSRNTLGANHMPLKTLRLLGAPKKKGKPDREKCFLSLSMFLRVTGVLEFPWSTRDPFPLQKQAKITPSTPKSLPQPLAKLPIG